MMRWGNLVDKNEWGHSFCNRRRAHLPMGVVINIWKENEYSTFFRWKIEQTIPETSTPIIISEGKISRVDESFVKQLCKNIVDGWLNSYIIVEEQ